jgi:hypothetical protein
MPRRILRRLAIPGMLFAFAGCALQPASAPWRDDQKVIPARPPDARGYLTVETEESGSPREGVQPRRRFYVYDQSGRFLDYFPNDDLLPVGLPPGRYVVVSRCSGLNKRVQIEMREGFSTAITLNDFRKAPAAE